MKYLLATISAIALLSAGLLADVDAPSALPPCIVQYVRTQNTITTTRIVLYRGDSTFSELFVTNDTLDANNPHYSSPPHSGTYAFTIDPQDPAHASISYNTTSGALPNDNLYFEKATSGRLTASPLTVTSEQSYFTLSPLQVNVTGGVAFSTKCALASGGSVTDGIAIGPEGPRWVLFRAVGASLAKYGVSGGVAGPMFTLYNSHQAIVAKSSVWSSDQNLVNGYNTVFSIAGEFPLEDGSDESVLLVLLQPGTYTAVFTASGTGQILCEAYTLPY